MQKLDGHDIFFAPGWFDADALQAVFAPATPILLAEPPVQEAAPGATPQDVFQQQWNVLMRDPEFAAAIKASGQSVNDAYKAFEAGLAAPAHDVTASPVPACDVTQDADGNYVHRVGDENVVLIMATTLGAEEKSTKLQVMTQAALVLVDGIVLVLSAIGVKLVMAKATVQKTLSYLITRTGPRLVGSVEKFEAISRAASKTDKVMKLARQLRSWPNVIETIKLMFTEMGTLEKVLTIANLIASLALLVVTAGGALAAKIAALAFAAVVLGTDIGLLITMNRSYRSASASTAG